MCRSLRKPHHPQQHNDSRCIHNQDRSNQKDISTRIELPPSDVDRDPRFTKRPYNDAMEWQIMRINYDASQGDLKSRHRR